MLYFTLLRFKIISTVDHYDFFFINKMYVIVYIKWAGVSRDEYSVAMETQDALCCVYSSALGGRACQSVCDRDTSTVRASTPTVRQCFVCVQVYNVSLCVSF